MTWLLVVAVVWVAVAVVAALAIGRAIRTADARRGVEAEPQPDAGNFVATDLPPAEADVPWVGPPTAPFTPSSVPRQRPPVVRDPVSRDGRDRAPHDSGLV
jgi:hypothetical protein